MDTDVGVSPALGYTEKFVLHSNENRYIIYKLSCGTTNHQVGYGSIARIALVSKILTEGEERGLHQGARRQLMRLL
jgi:hypothetical protein